MPESESESELAKVRLRASVGGRPFECRIGRLTGEQIRDFRTVTGVGLMQALQALDLDTFAALVYVVRRRGHRKLTYQSVLHEITYEDFETLEEVTEADEAEDSPGEGLDPEA